jgi:ABC-type multidrug transport system fused ATPase/permease subunit
MGEDSYQEVMTALT